MRSVGQSTDVYFSILNLSAQSISWNFNTKTFIKSNQVLFIKLLTTQKTLEFENTQTQSQKLIRVGNFDPIFPLFLNKWHSPKCSAHLHQSPISATGRRSGQGDNSFPDRARGSWGVQQQRQSAAQGQRNLDKSWITERGVLVLKMPQQDNDNDVPALWPS